MAGSCNEHRHAAPRCLAQETSYEGQVKDHAFGPQSMREHWAAGLADMNETLARPKCLARPAPAVGVATHDIHR